MPLTSCFVDLNLRLVASSNVSRRLIVSRVWITLLRWNVTGWITFHRSLYCLRRPPKRTSRLQGATLRTFTDIIGGSSRENWHWSELYSIALKERTFGSALPNNTKQRRVLLLTIAFLLNEKIGSATMCQVCKLSSNCCHVILLFVFILWSDWQVLNIFVYEHFFCLAAVRWIHLEQSVAHGRVRGRTQDGSRSGSHVLQSLSRRWWKLWHGKFYTIVMCPSHYFLLMVRHTDA